MNKGEIWQVQLPSSNGHEQAGVRPVIVVANTQINIVVVIPFTSNLLALRFPETLEVRPSKTNGLISISAALIFQIRAIDKKRLLKKVGVLEADHQTKVDTKLKQFLKIS